MHSVARILELRHGLWTGTVSTVASVILHGGLIAVFLAASESTSGIIVARTEAISLETLEAAAVESLDVSPQLVSAVSSAVAAEVGAEAAPPATPPDRPEPDEMAALEPPRAKSPSPPDGLAAIQGSHDEARMGPEPAESPREAVEDGRRKREVEQPRERKSRKETERRKEPAESGSAGARTRSPAASAASTARVSASTGSVLSYAARVRARIAGNRPSGAGKRGTVVVSFGVTRSGGLAYTSLARSSGDAALDRSVLSAVRGSAPFPAPPPGAFASQLRFTMPFYFR